MPTQTRTSGKGAFALLVAVALVSGFFYTNAKPKRDRSDKGVLFSVHFEPETRLLAVKIQITLNGSVILNSAPKKSPWEHVVMMRKGDTAVLTAMQESPSRLSCAVYGVVQEVNEHPGQVVCTYKRIV